VKGFVQFTFCDREAEEFVTLGRTDGMTPQDLARYFAGLEAPNDADGPFLADLWSDGDCHDDDRAVSAAAIERELGEPLDVLLARGRAENIALRRAIQKRLRRVGAHHV
jgi:hypothetical protein